jgi:hypothetical protein
MLRILAAAWAMVSLLPLLLSAQRLTDRFTNAVVFTQASFSLATNNLSAGAEAAEPAHLGTAARRSLWGSWRPQTNGQGNLTLRVANNGRMRLAVYVGDALTNLALVTGVTNVSTNSVRFPVHADTTYRVLVDAAVSAGSNFQLEGGVARLIVEEPAPNLRLRAPTNVSLKVGVPAGEQLTATEFFAGTASLGLITGPPFLTQLTLDEPGLTVISAVGTNQAGERLESHPVELIVRPANDDVADAAVIPSALLRGTLTGDSQWASAEALDPNETTPRRSLWWRWSPRYAGQARVWLPGAEPSQSIWLRRGGTATSLGTASLLLNSATALERLISVSSDPQQTLWFNVAGRSPAGAAPVEFSFELMTLAFDPAPPLELRLGEPVAVRWKAADASLVLTEIALFDGDTLLAQGNPLTGEIPWIPAKGGILRVFLRGLDAEGNRHASDATQVVIPPANDQFAGAEILPGGLTSLTFTNRSANLSRELDEPPHAGIYANASLWWSWTPETSGVAQFQVSAPDFFLLQLAAYTGDTLTNLTAVASNVNPRGSLRDRIIFPVVAGQTYRLVVDGGTAVYERLLVATLTHHAVGLQWPLLGGDLALGMVNPLRLLSGDPAFEPAGARFFLDGQLIGEAGGAAPELAWLGTNRGPHELMAVATNLAGGERLTPVYPVYVAPANDLRINAADLPAGTVWTYQGDHAQSSWENQEVDGGGTESGSAWFKWRPPATRGYVFRAAGGTFTSFNVFQQDAAGNFWLSDRLGMGQALRPVYLHVQNTALFQVSGLWTEGTAAPFTLELLPPPPNDDLTNAIPLSGLNAAFVGANTVATVLEGEPLTGLKGTLWWTWTAPESGDVTFEALASDCSVGMALFKGAAPGSLSQVGQTTTLLAFHDGGAKSSFPATFRVLAGQTYHLAMGAAWSGGPEAGTIRATLSLQPIPGLPPNDEPENPTVIGSDVTELSASNRNATGGEFQNLVHTVWFEWTAPLTGALEVGIESPSFQPIIFFGQGRYPQFQTLADNFNLALPLFLNITAGQTYTIAVAGAAFNDGQGEFVLRLKPFPLQPAPANDSFANRVRITSAEHVAEVQLQSSTLEPDEPALISQGVFAPLRGSLWWDYVAPGQGFLITDTAQFQDITFFRGTSLATLQPAELAQHPSERPLILAVSAGDVLSFAVHGRRLVPATNELRVMLAPPVPANDRFVDSVPLEGTNVTFRGFLRGSGREGGEPSHVFNVFSDQPSGESCWWSWAAPFTGRVTLEHPSDQFRVGIYRGPSVSRLARVSSAREFWRDVFVAEAGVVYHFGVERMLEQLGFAELKLRLEPFGPMANDDFASARVLTPVAASSLENITDATREPGEPVHRAGGPNKSLWWRFTMPLNAELEVRNSQGSLRNVSLAVYTGTQVQALFRQAAGSDYTRFPAVGGQEYFVAAEVPADAVGDVELGVNPGWSTGRKVAVPGNLVRNPSFEELRDGVPDKDWTIQPGFGGVVGAPPPGAADGANYIQIGAVTTVEQTVPTVAGRNYRIRYAASGTGGTNQARVRLHLGGQMAGEDVFFAGWPDLYWHWFEHTVTAPADDSTLKLEVLAEGISLDAISVVWLNEPPAIVTPPTGAFAYVGGSAAFVVGARGSEPLTYRWLFNDVPLAEPSSHVLTLEPVTLSSDGTYRAVVSNPFGSVTSAPVTLTVQVAASPQIVLQPQGDAVLPGQYYALGVTAVGPDPLAYQWFRGLEALAGATNRHLVFTNVSPADLGEYTVVVRSFTESTTSLPALLSLAAEAPGSGLGFSFSAWQPDPSFDVDAHVFDVDGLTRLAGAQFAAQLYVGPGMESLRPVGEPRTFFDGFHAGRWNFATVNLPNVSPGQPFVAQVRAWDFSKAASYEEARALGQRFGRSKPLLLTVGEPPSPGDLMLRGLESFSLQLGLPDFTVGRIEASLTPAGDQLTFRITGARGFRYLVERRVDGANWKPVQVFESFPGEATFTTPLVEGNTVLYRARILD